MICDNLAKVHK